MKTFKKFLSEELQIVSLILEGKEQHQIIRQFGLKILKRMQDENEKRGVPLRTQITTNPGLLNYDFFHHNLENHNVDESGKNVLVDKPNFNVNQMHDYIMKHFGFDRVPDHINKNDPKEMAERNKHINWMLTRYAQGDIDKEGATTGIGRLEDVFHRAEPTLMRFHRLVKEGKMQSESLAKFRHLGDLEKAVNNSDPLNATSIHPGEYTKIAENEHWHVVIPHTPDAACHFGHGTSWCTTSGAFNSYNEEGPLHIAIPKAPSHKNEKYQLHFESKQFMDEEDQPVSKDQFAKIHGSRPMPSVFSAMAKIHHGYGASGLSDEEVNHVVEHSPHAAVKIGLASRLSKEHVMNVLKNKDPNNEATIKAVVGETQHLQQGDLDHIFKNLKGVEGGSQEYPINVATALVGIHGWDFKPSYDSKISYKGMITPEHLRAAYQASETHLQNIPEMHRRSAQALHSLRSNIALHPNAPEDILAHARNNGVPGAFQNPNTTAEHIEDFFEMHKKDPKATRPDSQSDILQGALKNPNFPTHLFDSLMKPDALPKRDTPRGKEYSWNGMNLGAEDLRRHRDTALTNPAIPHEHIDQALENPHGNPGRHFRDSLVSIIQNPSSTPEHVIKAMNAAPINENVGGPDSKRKHDFTFEVLGRYERHANGVIPDNVFDTLVDSQVSQAPGAVEKVVRHRQFTQAHGDLLKQKFNLRSDDYIHRMIDQRLIPRQPLPQVS